MLLTLSAIAAGLYALYRLVKLVWKWLKDKIREKKLEKNVEDTLTIEMDRMKKEAELNLSYDDLEHLAQLESRGITHLIFGLDHNGNMTGKVDLIEAEDGVDDTVAMHLRRGDGMFVA